MRKGLTQRPLTTSDQRSITITHQLINGTSWFIKFLIRLHTHVFKWRVGKYSSQGQWLETGKTHVLDRIEMDCNGLRLEQVQGSEGHTGTSTTGNSGRSFFSNEVVPAIRNLVDENLLEAVLKVYLNMSCILCVLSSSSYVNIGAFNQLVKETSPFLGEKFPWVMSNFTLHQFQHAGQLMEENGSRGLDELSEKALEANNKGMRVFIERYSIKTSVYQQL